MEIQIITPLRLSEALMKTITGYPFRKPEIMNIHDSRENGDVSFSTGLDTWEDYINTNTPWFGLVNNILQYYKYRALVHPESKEWTDTMILVVLKQSTLGEYNRMYNCNLDTIRTTLDFAYNGREVRVVFYPSIVTLYVVKNILEAGQAYGRKPFVNKQFQFIINTHSGSEISNLRLQLIRKVMENMLRHEGYSIIYLSPYCPNTVIFTTNRLTPVPNNAKLLVCGPVCESNNTTLSFMTKDAYLGMITSITQALWQRHHPNIYVNMMCNHMDLIKTAFAAMYYELLSVSYNEPVVIRTAGQVDHIHEAAFCLYINVRIAMTIDIYSKYINSKLHRIVPLDNMALFHCANNPATWNLVWNYLVRFPDITDYAVAAQTRLDVNISLLWTFTINLCRDFNKYSYDEKILTASNEVPCSPDEALEKMYVFMALRNVLKKAFSLLEVEEVVYLC